MLCKKSNLSGGNRALHLPAERENEAHGDGVGGDTGAASEGHQVVEVVHQGQDRVEDVVYVLKQATLCGNIDSGTWVEEHGQRNKDGGTWMEECEQKYVDGG